MMRTTLLSLCMAISAGTISAQENHYFNNNPVWNQTTTFYDGCVHRREFNYVIAGDSVVDDLTYKKLYITSGVYTVENAGPGPGNCPVSSSAFSGLAGLVRSADHQIFIRPLSVSNEPEALLYDFNLEVGDTLPPTWNYNIDGISDTMIVTAITEMATPNGNMRRFALDWLNFEGPTPELIEGAGFFGTEGAQGGFVEPMTTPFEHISRINCFGFGSEGLLPDASAGCLRTNSLDNPEALIRITALPNPATDQIVFTGAPVSGEINVELIDMQGRKVATQHFSSGECQLQTATFLPGFYLYRIVSEQRILATGKILLQ